MYWKITPYHSNDADDCIMPANNDFEHHEALKYAQARLEELWDQLGLGKSATVTIELCQGDMPEPVEEN